MVSGFRPGGTRKPLWGGPGLFLRNSTYYQHISQIAAVRPCPLPRCVYGRFSTFRAPSPAIQQTLRAFSTFCKTARSLFSRIFDGSRKIVVVANTDAVKTPSTVSVIVDDTLNTLPGRAKLRILYSKQGRNPKPPAAVPAV
jgi:hypothetical protein